MILSFVICLHCLNSLSEGEDDEGIAKYFLATMASRGNFPYVSEYQLYLLASASLFLLFECTEWTMCTYSKYSGL